MHRLWNICLLAAALPAQQDAGAAAFRQACLDATTDGLVMNIAAHPDDEAARTLVMLRRKYGLRTVTVYSTCGSGGQNAVGREIDAELAAIRIRETLAAARHTGVEVRWLGFRDFGYSRTTAETMHIWGKGRLLRRMRAELEDLDPDVVFTNHSPERGHGHHRASAMAIRTLLEERARRGRITPLFERMFVHFETPAASKQATPTDASAGTNGKTETKTPPRPDFVLNVSELDPVRGVTYAKQAHDGLIEHRTQGPWGRYDPTVVRSEQWKLVFPPGPDVATDPFSHVGSLLREPAFRRVWQVLGHDIGALERAFLEFRQDRPRHEHVSAARTLLPLLRRARQSLEAEGNAKRALRRLERRIDALQRVVLAGSGVHVEVYLPSRELPVGGQGSVRVVVQARDRGAIEDLHAESRGVLGKALQPKAGKLEGLEIRFPVSWDGDDGKGSRLASPYEPEWVAVDVGFRVAGLPIELHRRLAGRRVPSLEMRWDRGIVLLPQGRPVTRVFSLHLRHAGAKAIESDILLEGSPGMRATAIPAHVKLLPGQRGLRVLVRLESPHGIARRGQLHARFAGRTADLTLQPVHANLASGLEVGLVRGPDDTLERALEDLSVPFELLDEERLAVADLARFSTIVLDIRALHHRPDLVHHRLRLLRFCRRGGRILVFYHKPREWNAREDRPLLAPYDLQIGRGRVSQEDAKVTLLDPGHRLWNHPNRISAKDFDGWVQERGLNLPSKWDEKAFKPLLSMSDDGEKALTGALLVARYGRGDYVYCSLALYRQLRHGHQGAARLLLNLLTP